MDILQNSIRAGASQIKVEIEEDIPGKTLTLEINDNGRGMSEMDLSHATDPFFTTRTTRRVGLGLPLLKQNCERTGGHFSLESQPGTGTRVRAEFVTKHPDRLVLGDIPGVVMLTVAANPSIAIHYRHQSDGGSYQFLSDEVRQSLPGISLENAGVFSYLKEMISEHLSEIGVSLYA
ncbi:MAG TPA: ATP-binding protein [Bacteroidales bacterium]|nr:ATP-binding protein [Bacteroidales bacterium]